MAQTPEAMISSTRNPRVVAASRLQRRRERRVTGTTIIEGPKLVAMALELMPESVEVVFHLEDSDVPMPAGIEAVSVTQPVLERLSSTTTPQSPVAIIRIPEMRPPEHRHSIVTWGVSDPGNLGAILRSAAAFGVQTIIGPDCADVWSPKTIRAAAGSSMANVPATANSMHDLADFGVVACVATDGAPELMGGERPLAALIGSEAHGLPSEVISGADQLLTLPLASEVESLNAAATAGIVAYLLGTGRF